MDPAQRFFHHSHLLVQLRHASAFNTGTASQTNKKSNAPNNNDSIDESQSSRLQAADTSERNSESDEKMTR